MQTLETGSDPEDVAPRFVTGSLLRHVVVMAGAGAIGLIAIFGVDLINLVYISYLNDPQITAAIGFAGGIGFFYISVMIGLTIGVSAVVARNIGAQKRERAERIASASLAWVGLTTIAMALASALFAPQLAGLLGAQGQARELAGGFLRNTALSIPLLALGMVGTALLRSVGDARRAMNVTLIAAGATTVLDPILIFYFHLGLTGAALSMDLSRALLAYATWRGITQAHHLIAPVASVRWLADIRPVLPIAFSAVLTNLATPFGQAFVTHAMARFGPLAVAGQLTIDRISPVAFGLIFALTGAVGPIVAQNYGAQKPERVVKTLRASLLFVTLTVGAAWIMLALGQGALVRLFQAHGETEILLRFFCRYLAGGFFFAGCLFVANTSFNNLSQPFLATAFNWGRATLGTIPFVLIGVRYGPIGVMSAQTAGSVVFGIIALAVAFRVAARPKVEPLFASDRAKGDGVALAAMPQSSGRSAIAAFLTRRLRRSN
jgi:putative MATE family efflux protein